MEQETFEILGESKIKKSLSQSGDRFNRILANLKDEFMFFFHDFDKKSTTIGPSVENLLGYTTEEYIKKAEKLLTNHPGNIKARRHRDLSSQGFKQPPYDIEIYHKDGSRKRFVVIENPLFNDNGQVFAVEGMLRDVTEKYRMSSLINNLPGMAYRLVKKQKWEVEFVSNGSRLIIGYEPSFFIGKGLKNFWDLVHPDDKERVANELSNSIIKKKKPAEFEYRIINFIGKTKWVFDKAEGVLFDGGKPIVIEGFIIDFTVFKQMEQKLKHENSYLRSTIKDRYKFDSLIGNCQAMQDVYDFVLKAARTNDSVFIYGESGTGKELVARAIHNASERSRNGFVAVNCGAIPESLIENEFFGSKKGAFTGSIDKQGYLDKVDGGTLFLDELGEVSLTLQVKLLRAIEGGGYSPVGSTDVKKPDIRIIAASNKNLVEFVKKGLIREDFFFRIHVLPIDLPPLRERGDDLFLLIDHFLKFYSEPGTVNHLSSKDLTILKSYHWPGNIRELQNILRRYITFKNLDFLQTISPNDLKLKDNPEHESFAHNITPLKEAMEEFEKKHIQNVLNQNHWHKKKSANSLNINRKTLFRKMKIYGLE
jgi:PAS domain S-box-containing protein